MRLFSAAVVVASLSCSSSAVLAQVPMSGTFAATQACPAVQSIKKGSNPGNVAVEPGKSYKLAGKNKDEATHYWIEVPGAEPFQRWVDVSCGTVDGAQQTGNAPASGAPVNTPMGTVKPKPKPKGNGDGAPFYVLAISWQPAFCESMRSKPECRAQKPGDYTASHFSLHGLWPQPRRNQFCGVDPKLAALDDQHQWEKLPEPEISPETRSALSKVMPGIQSMLERHEWIKHGTCYPVQNADTYFKDAVRLVEIINASAVQDYMEANIGKSVQTRAIRAKFDEAFGAGAGERVRFACDEQGRISELTIGLKGDISSGTDIRDLIAASQSTDQGCLKGEIDAVN